MRGDRQRAALLQDETEKMAAERVLRRMKGWSEYEEPFVDVQTL
jgi:hypothetical protein